jgi:hypothetical protein
MDYLIIRFLLIRLILSTIEVDLNLSVYSHVDMLCTKQISLIEVIVRSLLSAFN